MGFKMDTSAAARKFRQLAKTAHIPADTGVEEAVEDVFEETQRVVPRDTNALANSGRIEHRGPGQYSIWYGDSAVDSDDPSVVDYAAAVHEILEHKHAPPTQAKYVESPLFASIPEMKITIAKHFKRHVKKVFR